MNQMKKVIHKIFLLILIAFLFSTFPYNMYLSLVLVYLLISGLIIIYCLKEIRNHLIKLDLW